MHHLGENEYFRFFLLLKSKWRMIGAFFLISSLTALLISFFITPVYESTTSIMIVDQQSSNLADLFKQPFGQPAGSLIQNYIEILKSRSLAEQVITELRLDIPFPSRKFEKFRKRISVKPVVNSDMIKISVQSEDRYRAKQIADTMVLLLEKRTQYANRVSAGAAKEFIEKQLDVAAEKLAHTENNLLNYKKKENVIAPGEKTKGKIDKLIELDMQMVETELAIKWAEKQLEALQGDENGDYQTGYTALIGGDNKVFQEYIAKLAELKISLVQAREKYADDSQVIMVLQQQIRELKTKLAQEVQSMLKGLEAKKQALQSVIRGYENEIIRLPRKEMELIRLTREQEVVQELYVLLLKKHDEVRIQESMQIAGIQTIDPADIPRKDMPLRPKKLLNMIIAGFLGLLAGTGYVYILDMLDTTVKSPREIEKLFGLPLIGQIPGMENPPAKSNGGIRFAMAQSAGRNSVWIGK